MCVQKSALASSYRTVSHGESGAPQRPEGVFDGPQDGFQDHRLSQACQACRQLVRERIPRETDAWLSIYSGGMPWIDMPATEPLKTMDEIARMSVRDFYVDQCCDAVVVTEVTEDTVTALCDYGS